MVSPSTEVTRLIHAICGVCCGGAAIKNRKTTGAAYIVLGFVQAARLIVSVVLDDGPGLLEILSCYRDADSRAGW